MSRAGTLLLALVAAGLVAQEPVLVPSVGLPVTVDGRLEEEFWRAAVVVGPFTVLGAGARPTSLRNQARLAVNGGDLYIGYTLEEPDPDGLSLASPDSLAIYHDDCVETFLSADRAGRRLAHLLVNPLGRRHWEQRSGSAPSPTWHPVAATAVGDWDAGAAIDRAGRQWTCELRIRLRDVVGADAGGPTRLYLNLTRHRPRGPQRNATWAVLGGATYLAPQDFVAVELMVPPPPPLAGAGPGRPRFSSRLEVPGLLLAGVPVRLELGQGSHRLPAAWRCEVAGAAIDATVLDLLSRRTVGPGRPEALCRLAVAPQAFDDPTLSAGERTLLAGPEAFRLELAEGRLDLRGRSREGLLRGLATYLLLAARARSAGADLPALVLYDAPRLAFRAWHLTVSTPAAKLREVLDAAFLLRLNQVLISVDSFNGDTPFPFTVADIGDPARTKAEWIEAFAYARARGIEPIPYLASWGRTQYITRKPQYQHLQTPVLPGAIQQETRNLDVANPEAVRLMLAMQGEVIDTLQPKALCIGFDELNYADMVGSPLAKAKGWKQSDWIVAALTANADFLRGRGVEMLVWGDMFDPGQNGRHLDQSGKALLDRLPKDMTILDWKYEGGFDHASEFPSIGLFTGCGLRTIGCPWFRPNNIARLAASVQARSAAGLCLTSWNGTNLDQLPPELARALGLTAWLAWSPEDCELAHLPLPPETLLRFAGAPDQAGLSPGRAAYPLPTPAGVETGAALVRQLDLPAGTDLGALRGRARNHRGIPLELFSDADGHPAALVVRGGVADLVNGGFGQDLAGWTTQPAGTAGLFACREGALTIRRDEPRLFQRAFQDVRLPGGKAYVLRFRHRTGRGAGRIWVYPGDGATWDEARIIRSARLEQPAWTAGQLALPVANDRALRVCLGVEDAGAEVAFDDLALLEVDGRGEAVEAPPVLLPLAGKVTTLTFLHATNRQELSAGMHDNVKRYAGAVAATYVVRYQDGGEAVIPLRFRAEVTALDDTCLGREQDPGLFGTLAGYRFINLPTFTWRNPQPGRQIASLGIRPGNRPGLDLLLLGLEVEE